MRSTGSLRLIGAVAAFACAGTVHGQGSFQGLGDFPMGNYGSGASGVSANGLVVVGASQGSIAGDPRNDAFVWSLTAGMANLGLVPSVNLHGGSANAVSADGSLIVGKGLDVGGTEHPFVWTPAQGLIDLGGLGPGSFGCSATAVSADGQTVVGHCQYFGRVTEFRWTPTEGMHTFLPFQPPGGVEVGGVSADGSVIVGRFDTVAFRWTQAGGTYLPFGPSVSTVSGVSGDGNAIVGESFICGAFRWTPANGFLCLGWLPGDSGSIARAASFDGSVIVGRSSGSTYRAFVWDAGHGMRNLRTVLTTNYGLNLKGWTLTEAFGVSADGRVIVGTGVNPCGLPEAWIARLGIPSGCYVNCDGSSTLPVLTANDFQCFLNHFANGDAYANCDDSCASPLLTANDFQCFLNAFAGGCP